MELTSLTADDFSARRQDKFALSAPVGTLDLVLTEVETLGGASIGRQPFSVRFVGPAKPILPQAIYRLENPTMGVLEIFLVPLGPRDGGMRYEAVFT
jgi:hypothetical protein